MSPWLDDESGTARRPIELRARTPGNEAIYGSDSPDFLHKNLYQPIRRVVLRAMGVSSDPSRSELVDRLKQLREASNEVESEFAPDYLEQEAAVVYKALAHDLDMPLRSELSFVQLRAEFERDAGLVLTDKGWLPPRSVLAGPPIFGDLAAFAPAVGATERLWQVLGLREPSPEDCLKVIHSIARKREGPETSDETILLETMRALAVQLADENAPKLGRHRLINLALWTSKGWKRDRPVYVTNDPMLAEGLKGQVPLWGPGGDLEQFRSLLGPLRIEEIKASDAEVITPEMAIEDSDATDLFRSSVQLLREDLARNEPQLAASIKLPWSSLEEFGVSIHPTLSLRVSARYKGKSQEHITEVDAKVDVTLHRVFLREPRDLARVDKGGRALADVFDGNPRQIALAWRAAFDKAEEGFEAQRVVLAQQQAEEMKAQNEKELERRTTEFRDLTSGEGGSSQRKGTSVSTLRANGRVSGGGPKAADLGSPRTLVDPNSLRITDRRGRVEEGTKSSRSQTSNGSRLVEPKHVSKAPRNRRPIPGFSSLDRENVGRDLLERVLSSDYNEIIDIRTQRNVGADAVDSMRKIYEMKVSAGSEPDQVTLTRSEIQRAESEDDFFLVVVSGIEGTDARPKVRVFVDPLNQLKQIPNGSVTLSGIHSAKSLVYDFEPTDDATVTEEGENEEVEASS